MSILAGMNARLFPINWRPARNEIAFAAAAGFDAIQFNGIERGIDAEHLGDALDSVGAALREAGITPVMEIVVRLRADGRTANGSTPLDLLRANLPAIAALGCACVHWHLAPAERMAASELCALEAAAIPQLAEAVAIAASAGARLGLEHNEPEIPLFAELSSIERALDAVPELGFVWDLNHTRPDDLAGYLALASRMSMLHVSDTPLPDVNHHLPLGMGAIDFAAYFTALHERGFHGPAILEIGGIPRSGGFGRDTDTALRDSLARLRRAIQG
jgi:sugar phosphate isomerase/epimerase